MNKKFLDKFEHLSKRERNIVSSALVMSCKKYIDYGLNGYNSEGQMEYKEELKLLLMCDKDRKYEYLYKNFPYINEV